MRDLTVNSSRGKYTVNFEENFSFIQKLYTDNSIFVVDEAVYFIFKEVFSGLSPKNIILIKARENFKKLGGVSDLCEKLLACGVRRNWTLIAVGGGIVQDLTGFVASTIFRGIKWIYIPTTLLAQADSCIGGKTSINFNNCKNLLGTFYPPSEIYTCFIFLKTLKRVDLLSGLGELIKLIIIGSNRGEALNLGPKIARIIKDTEDKNLPILIRKSLLIKKYYVEYDEFDVGLRNLLNWGHTFGHALESISNYLVPHGSAVVMGLILANAISLKRGILDDEIFNRLNYDLFLPVVSHIKINQSYFNKTLLIDRMKKDKKRTQDALSFILLSRDLRLQKYDDVSVSEFSFALTFCKKLLR